MSLDSGGLVICVIQSLLSGAHSGQKTFNIAF